MSLSSEHWASYSKPNGYNIMIRGWAMSHQMAYFTVRKKIFYIKHNDYGRNAIESKCFFQIYLLRINAEYSHEYQNYTLLCIIRVENHFVSRHAFVK